MLAARVLQEMEGLNDAVDDGQGRVAKMEERVAACAMTKDLEEYASWDELEKIQAALAMCIGDGISRLGARQNRVEEEMLAMKTSMERRLQLVEARLGVASQLDG